MAYLPRVYDSILTRRLESKDAVLIEGAKWCGKTTTAQQQARSVLYMQRPETREQNIRLASLPSNRRFFSPETRHALSTNGSSPQRFGTRCDSRPTNGNNLGSSSSPAQQRLSNPARERTQERVALQGCT